VSQVLGLNLSLCWRPARNTPHARMQAFEIVTRPALDSFGAALDRAKMAIYTQFAEWGLPCPITGVEGAIGAQARQQT
jgi:hypothetical protein